jgi:hypothetical protein
MNRYGNSCRKKLNNVHCSRFKHGTATRDTTSNALINPLTLLESDPVTINSSNVNTVQTPPDSPNVKDDIYEVSDKITQLETPDLPDKSQVTDVLPDTNSVPQDKKATPMDSSQTSITKTDTIDSLLPEMTSSVTTIGNVEHYMSHLSSA